MSAAEHFRVVRFAELAEQPWLNGQGVTRQLVPSALARGAGDAGGDWRLSFAEISEEVPFSDFPSYDRHLLLAKGEGLMLTIDSQPRLLSWGQVAGFPGEAAVSARVRGPIPCRVLNLMTRRAATVGEILRSELDGPHTISGTDHAALVVLSGTVLVAGHPPLHAFDTILVQAPVDLRVLNASVATVRVQRL